MIVSGLKMLVVSGMCWAVYHLLFSKRPFHLTSRLVLLGGVVLSLGPYFIRMPSSMLTYQLPEISANAVTLIGNETDRYWNFLAIVYWSGFIITGCLLIIRFYKVAKLFQSSRKSHSPWNRVLLAGGHPCTFMFWSFIPENVDDQLVQTIQNHERAHAKLLHGLDLLLLELYSIVFWWNPFGHIIKRSVRIVHEYQADRLAAEIDGNQFYLKQILSFEKWKGSMALTTSINPLFVQLKNRINMLQKINVHPLKKWIGITLVPMALLALLVVACNVEPPVVYEAQKLDKMPEYVGGFDELVNYISENLEYPEAEKVSKTEETIVVQFTVSEKGEVTQPEILKGENENFKEAAIAIFDKMPNWEPGKLNGQGVVSKMALPVKFTMATPEKIDVETIGDE